MKHKLLKSLSLVITISIVFVVLILIVFQASFTKRLLGKWIEKRISKELQEPVRIAQVEGFLPFDITLKKIEVGEENEPYITVDKATVKWDVWSYLVGNSLIGDINVNHVNIYDLPPSKNEKILDANAHPSLLKWPKFPFTLTSISFSCTDIYIGKKLAYAQPGSYAIDAFFHARGGSDDFHANMQVVFLTNPNRLLEFDLKGTAYNQMITLNIEAKNALLEELTKLSEYEFPDYQFYLSLKAPLPAFQVLVSPEYSKSHDGIDFELKFEGHNHNLQGDNLWLALFGHNNWYLQSSGKYFINSNLYLSSLNLESENAQLSAHGLIESPINLNNFYLEASFRDTDPIAPYIDVEMAGPLNIKAELAGNPLHPSGKIHAKSHFYRLFDIPFDNFSAIMQASEDQETLTGIITAKGVCKDAAVYLTSTYTMDPNYETHLHDLSGNIENGSITGNLDILTNHPLLRGSLVYENDDLSQLSKAFGHALNGKGTLTLDMDFEDKGKEYHQAFNFKLTGSHAAFDYFWVRDITAETSFKTQWVGFYRHIDGSARIYGKDFEYDTIHLNQFDLKGSMKDRKLPFEISLKGKAKSEFEIDSQGIYTLLNGGYTIQMNRFEGKFLEEPFALKNSFIYTHHKTWQNLDPIFLDLGKGSASASLKIDSGKATASAKMDDVPINFLTLFLPQLRAEGEMSGTIDYLQQDQDVSGHAEISISDFKVEGTDAKEKPLNGKIIADLKDNRLNGSIAMTNKRNQRLAFTCSLPLQLYLSPFYAHLDENEPFQAYLTYKGNIDTNWQYLFPHNHFLKGRSVIDLQANGTLDSPVLNGYLSLKEGIYENIYAGLVLKDVELEITGKQNHLVLEKFHATDGKKGYVNGDGEWTLNIHQHFPYKANIDIHDMNIIRLDYLSSSFDGDLHLKGDFKKANIFGNLTVTKSEFAIPDYIPNPMPELNVIYVNPLPSALCMRAQEDKFTLPLEFDIHLNIPSHAVLTGRGLNTYWKGSIDIKGTDLNPQVHGELTLITGTFFFAGKTLNITEGRISFNGNPQKNTFVYLMGEIDVRDTKIQAILNGPIETPKLTFQSDPPLSQSAILALLLYDKDIEDLTPFQAVALARTAASLSGTYKGPDVIDKLRKGIGLDQLSFSTDETDIKKVNVQVGKYISNNILITLNSGISYKPTDFDVAAHFKHGFQLQSRIGYLIISEIVLLWKYSY